MSSRTLALYLEKKNSTGYELVSAEPVCDDLMCYLYKLVDSTFDYLSNLDTVDPADIPKEIADGHSVENYNFYYIDLISLHELLQSHIDADTENVVCLCKALGYSRTKSEGEEVHLGSINGAMTLPANAELVRDAVYGRQKALVSEFVQGLLYAWYSRYGSDMADFRFIAMYDY